MAPRMIQYSPDEYHHTGPQHNEFDGMGNGARLGCPRINELKSCLFRAEKRSLFVRLSIPKALTMRTPAIVSRWWWQHADRLLHLRAYFSEPFAELESAIPAKAAPRSRTRQASSSYRECNPSRRPWSECPGPGWPGPRHRALTRFTSLVMRHDDARRRLREVCIGLDADRE